MKRLLLAFAFCLCMASMAMVGCGDICDDCRTVSSPSNCDSDETYGSCCCKGGKNVYFCCPEGTSGSEAANCGFCD